ncbi:MAG: SBBP repeat-containing protein [Candidatus Lokiarchaeota archaeon]|nr:SBBP repeat-containing protein [Candidatus Lokiarchaeota archaeon]
MTKKRSMRATSVLLCLFLSIAWINFSHASTLNIEYEIGLGSYLGGGGNDVAYSIAVDAEGYIYIAGRTQSTDFPTLNTLNSTLGGESDYFITKLDAHGQLVYSTYLGGSLSEGGLVDPDISIALDGEGCCYIAGTTVSEDFPVLNAIQSTNAGTSGAFDAVIVKLNPDGSMNYSTYLGGSDDDFSAAIAVDAEGMCYITGSTVSSDFPLKNAYDTTLDGSDVFVTILNPDGSLYYSTYIGGEYYDLAHAIAIDSEGDFYITGEASEGFPMVNAFNATFGGYMDAFLTKFDLSKNEISYSTYIGGNEEDWGMAIAVDSNGGAYITGLTISHYGFPITPNAIDTSYDDTYYDEWMYFDGFLTILDPLGNLSYSTYLGGSKGDVGRGIVTDTEGNCYVAGYTNSPNFPLQNALDDSLQGTDGFIMIFNSLGDLCYSSLLGGGYIDYCYDLVLDAEGCLYLVGDTTSTNLPVVGGFDLTLNNHGTVSSVTDGYMLKLKPPDKSKIPGFRLGVFIPVILVGVVGSYLFKFRKELKISKKK